MIDIMNNRNFLCDSDMCSHPTCWNYYRRLFKSKSVLTSDIVKPAKLKIDIPHQSVVNLGTNFNTNRISDQLPVDKEEAQRQKNDAMIQYLLSRRKDSLKYSKDKTSNAGKLAKLDVHEVFDEKELKSDWRDAFKSKDFYIWIPGKNKGQNRKERRYIKTPVMQLAPVATDDTRLYSGKSNVECKSLSSLSLHDNSSQLLSSKSLYSDRKLHKLISNKKLAVVEDPIKRTQKESKFDSLSSSISNKKMQIYWANDKSAFGKFDTLTPEPTYRLDPRPLISTDFETSKTMPYSFPNRTPLSLTTNQFELATNSTSSLYGLPKPAVLKLRKIGVIDDNSVENFTDMHLGPHRTMNSLNTSRSGSSVKSGSSHAITGDSEHRSRSDRTEPNSLAINALSNRSTLEDDNLLPGCRMLHMLQQSYQLIRHRSELWDKEQEELTGKDAVSEVENGKGETDVQDEKMSQTIISPLLTDFPHLEHHQEQLLLTYNQSPDNSEYDWLERNIQSAPLNITEPQGSNPIISPDPPPPSPEFSHRYRLYSAAPDIINTNHKNF